MARLAISARHNNPLQKLTIWADPDGKSRNINLGNPIKRAVKSNRTDWSVRRIHGGT